jgi:hypothetical protein
MKRFLCFSLSAVFIFGVLFPVSRTGEKGKSAFVQQIKKIFRYSDGMSGKEKSKVTKSPVINNEGGESAIFQEIRNFFHYFPEDEDTERPKARKYPLKFDDEVQDQLRYPSRKERVK